MPGTAFNVLAQLSNAFALPVPVVYLKNSNLDKLLLFEFPAVAMHFLRIGMCPDEYVQINLSDGGRNVFNSIRLKIEL